MPVTLDQSNTAAVAATLGLPVTADNVKLGVQFTPSVTSAIGEAHFFIAKNGSPTGNVWCEVWTDNGSNLPNAQTGANSNTVAVATLSASDTEVTFSWPNGGPSLTSGTKYWLVLNTTTAVSSTDLMEVDETSTAYNAASTHYSTNTSSWTTITGDYIRFKEYYFTASPGNDTDIAFFM